MLVLLVLFGCSDVCDLTMSRGHYQAGGHPRQAGKKPNKAQSASRDDVQFHETYCTKMMEETQHVRHYVYIVFVCLVRYLVFVISALCQKVMCASLVVGGDDVVFVFHAMCDTCVLGC